MTPVSVSVVIVSRHRPEELRRCVRALEFQTCPGFEIVLVTDSDTEENLAKLVPLDRLKHTVCSEANISKARNIGVGLAGGDIVAFIDDDAIAEPTWLERLIAPFSDPKVAASGGFVRGRNGIGFQWRAEEISEDGVSRPIEVDGTTIPTVDPCKGIKTQGTNCAFRHEVLCDLHGFDENYRFYLDETDLNLRIGRAGLLTAIVPGAEVQHGYATSPLRGKDRRPKSLFEIGASKAYFSKKFGRPGSDLQSFREHQWRRLDAALVGGLLEPRDMRFLRADLEAGIAEGQRRDPIESMEWPNRVPLKPFLTNKKSPSHVFISGRWLTRRRTLSRAKRMAENGTPCTAIILSPTALFHRRWFHQDGFWIHSGGIFGKSTRTDPLWSWYRHENRVRVEQELLEKTR
jgi:GT2 family glycosyltransferase